MNLTKKILFLIVISINFFFLLTPGRAITESKVFNATADAWNDQSSPFANHGSDPELIIGWEDADWKETLIKFDLSTRPTTYHKVEIQFYCTFVKEGYLDIEFWLLLSFEWDENNITWDNGPDSFNRMGLVWVAISNTGINRIDLTSKYFMDDYDIQLFPTNTGFIKIASKENSLMSPRIVFFYVVSDLPIIISVISIISFISIGGTLGYFIYRRRSRSKKS